MNNFPTINDVKNASDRIKPFIHTSGNHAAALTLAARQRGIKAYIVMPRTAPPVKKKAVEEYGAEIIFCEPTLQAREENLEKVILSTC